jgi:hypothetical protein
MRTFLDDPFVPVRNSKLIDTTHGINSDMGQIRQEEQNPPEYFLCLHDVATRRLPFGVKYKCEMSDVELADLRRFCQEAIEFCQFRWLRQEIAAKKCRRLLGKNERAVKAQAFSASEDDLLCQWANRRTVKSKGLPVSESIGDVVDDSLSTISCGTRIAKLPRSIQADEGLTQGTAQRTTLLSNEEKIGNLKKEETPVAVIHSDNQSQLVTFHSSFPAMSLRPHGHTSCITHLIQSAIISSPARIRQSWIKPELIYRGEANINDPKFRSTDRLGTQTYKHDQRNAL